MKKPKLEVLNTREIKEIRKLLDSQFGFSGDLDYVFLKNEKNKIFIVSKDFKKIDFDKLKINTIGLYFGEWRRKELRLSLEGSQMIGPLAGKNVVDLDEQQLKWYFEGMDLDMDLGAENRFVLLKFREDFIGCSKYKENKLLNFMPKEHRTVDLIY
ncbi:hypothetical protein KY306_00600 [Candidatus Woesearchaeota archaeon]|nr:hypothetical protein [Candidatus Woesearchaeota archaeon]